ncbi:hypothetical protein PI2015_3143 [Pseudoalteromonas issachenkonii]|uniref:hypothetical protein n=1 Tax=Pseudoalteromonas issachenkonii TaxID=152297 RepID=UPI00071B0402|nr:hypothetical protein [Pseudoalteromonas issachenkonii]ALQ56391.1 hypothetical protein PI2015_3143 [Pseudoalteromonas issachenkonii]
MQNAIKPKGKTTSSWKKFVLALALIAFSATIFIGVQLDGSIRKETLSSSSSTAQLLPEEIRTVQDISFSLNIQVLGDTEVNGKKEK